MHVIAGKAVAFKEAMSDDFVEYQKQVLVNANAMAEEFIKRGFDVVSGGTDNHLFLLSLISKGLTGKDADAALSKAHITVNKNSVPNDPQSPFVTSGLRIGTSGLRIGSPAITTRGFNEQDSRDLANWISDILEDMGNDDVIAAVRDKVSEICKRLPVYRG